MNIDIFIQKAQAMMNLGRFELALKELQLALAQDPNNVDALLSITICYLELGEFEEALVYSKKILGLDPNEALGHYYQAYALLNLEKKDQAETHIKEAIRLDPESAEFYGLLSLIYLQKKQWEKALEYAEQGLQFDPDNTLCLNNRTQALNKLGRKEEMIANIEETLAKDPENAYSHAVTGWARLERKDFEKARTHFAEALRLDPSNQLARAGMIEALKNKNVFYRIFFSFFIWMSRHQASTQWAIVIGIYIGFRFLRAAATQYPILIPVAILAGLFIYLTWIIDALFNLIVRFDKDGKYMLNEDEIMGANFAGGGLILAIVSAISAYLFSLDILFILALIAATLIIPITFYYGLAPKKRTFVGYYTLALAFLGIGGFLAILLNINAWGMIAFYFLGIWLFGWIANYLVIKS